MTERTNDSIDVKLITRTGTIMCPITLDMTVATVAATTVVTEKEVKPQESGS